MGTGGGYGKAAKASVKLSNKAKTFSKFDDLARHLKKYHGIDPKLASKRLHEIKKAAGYAGKDVILDRTGNVYNPVTKELIGSLTEGGAKAVN